MSPLRVFFKLGNFQMSRNHYSHSKLLMWIPNTLLYAGYVPFRNPLVAWCDGAYTQQNTTFNLFTKESSQCLPWGVILTLNASGSNRKRLRRITLILSQQTISSAYQSQLRIQLCSAAWATSQTQLQRYSTATQQQGDLRLDMLRWYCTREAISNLHDPCAGQFQSQTHLEQRNNYCIVSPHFQRRQIQLYLRGWHYRLVVRKKKFYALWWPVTKSSSFTL